MTSDELSKHLLRRLHDVQARFDLEPAGDASARFADAIDSMGMIEFVGQVADDCRVEPEAIEQAVGHRFGTIADLANSLCHAGLFPHGPIAAPTRIARAESSRPPVIGLAGSSVRLPAIRQPAEQIDELLNRPKGWFASHTGIAARCLWGDADILDESAEAARACLADAGMALEGVTALLVTSEAPPLAVGLAAAVHARIGLTPACVALEVGGACTGLVAALWLGQHLLHSGGAVLIVAVEAPSKWLSVQPGSSGETAALFGDGAGACLISPIAGNSRGIRNVVLGSDGNSGHLLRALPGAGISLEMDGAVLASRAVRLVGDLVMDLAERHGLSVNDLQAVVIHGGNGRLPGLVARRLGLPEERILSETARTGNLGSVSLLTAWAAGGDSESGPVVWAAIGAGLTWGAVLLDAPRRCPAFSTPVELPALLDSTPDDGDSIPAG